MITRWMLIFMAFPILGYATPVKVKFFDGNLNAAKSLAALEGKLYFAEFSASWCAPCRFLEETTFSNPMIVDYISNNYIPVRIDIDDFDGLAMKQVYNVTAIPTIIFFNSKGQLLEKFDKALPVAKMMELLKKHNTPANRIISGKPVNTNIKPANTTSSVNTQVNNAQVISAKESHSPMKMKTVNAHSKPDKKPANPIASDESGNSPVYTSKAMSQGDGLYRFKVATQASEGFSVQIGAFKDYENVLREVARIQDDFDQPILVHVVKLSSSSIYKILLGDFNSREEAIHYQTTIKSKGMDSMIKDLSTMQ